MLAKEDPVARAPYEAKLSHNMRVLTSLAPNADYAKDLHEPAHSASIYMHELGENGAGLRSPEVQEVLKEAEAIYGISAGAVTERLALPVGNQHLEQIWVQDDFVRIARAQGADMTVPEQREQVVDAIETVNAELRQELVERGVLKEIPHLAKATIQNDVEERFTQEHQEFLENNLALLAPVRDVIERAGDDYVVRDQVAAALFVKDMQTRRLASPDIFEMQRRVAADMVDRHNDMPHHVSIARPSDRCRRRRI